MPAGIAPAPGPEREELGQGVGPSAGQLVRGSALGVGLDPNAARVELEPRRGVPAKCGPHVPRSCPQLGDFLCGEGAQVYSGDVEGALRSGRGASEGCSSCGFSAFTTIAKI